MFRRNALYVFVLFAVLLVGLSEENQWAIQVDEGVNLKEVEKDLGVNIVGKVGNLKNYYLVETKGNKRDLREKVKLIGQNSKVVWAEEQKGRKMYKRGFEIKDPLYDQQWHLRNTLTPKGVDLNVSSVWEKFGITGKGVVVTIVDDGVQYVHPDLSKNYRKEASWDFIDNDDDPTPDLPADPHGTNCAGLSSAARNDVCGVGVALESQFAAIRLVGDKQSDVQEANSFAYRTDINHIFCSSWGPNDNGITVEAPARLLRETLKQGALQGRNGLGSVFLWASGNGRYHGDSCSFDGYAGSPYVMTIGSVNYLGKHTYYSEQCPSVFAVTPSSDATAGVTTTHPYLYGSLDHCLMKFGGTSASAPMAAGVVALVLQANPRLSLREIQHLIIETAHINDPTHPSWFRNGAGYLHSIAYGFGLIDTYALIEKALNWTGTSKLNKYSATLQENQVLVQKPIPDYSRPLHCLKESWTCHENINIERVGLKISIKHDMIGDLRISITSPYGSFSLFSDVLHGAEGETLEITYNIDEIQDGSIRGAVEIKYYGSILIPNEKLSYPFVHTPIIDLCDNPVFNSSYNGAVLMVSLNPKCDFATQAFAAQNIGIKGLLYLDENIWEDRLLQDAYFMSFQPLNNLTTFLLAVPNERGKKLRIANISNINIEKKVPKRPAGKLEDWEFISVHHWGEKTEGLWTVEVCDCMPLDTGVWNSFSFNFYGNSEYETGTDSKNYLLLGLFMVILMFVLIGLVWFYFRRRASEEAFKPLNDHDPDHDPETEEIQLYQMNQNQALQEIKTVGTPSQQYPPPFSSFSQSSTSSSSQSPQAPPLPPQLSPPPPPPPKTLTEEEKFSSISLTLSDEERARLHL